MCGPVNSILGRAIEPIMNRFLSNMPAPFPVAGGEVRLRGALIEVDETTGRALRIQRIDEPGPAETAKPAAEARSDNEGSTVPEEV
jgi:calcineurin-like phosphoesterase